MKKISFRISVVTLVVILTVAWVVSANPPSPSSLLQLTPRDALETHGLSVFLFHNSYQGVFGDEKMSGLEIILHERRIATNGDVRLSPTPAQWDPIPQFKERKRGASPNELVASLAYPDKDLSYRIDVQPEDGGIRVAVLLDRALPQQLAGKAGFNLEFLPTAYFGKSYLVKDSSGMFPRLPTGPMKKDSDGAIEPVALASGQKIVLSPEDPLTRVSITSDGATLQLFDGRNQAQNGWFVLRSLIPPGKTGEVAVWHIHLKVVQGWTRPPVVGYNQVGYTPGRAKIAVLELDPRFHAATTARVLQLSPDGKYKEVFRGEVKHARQAPINYTHFDGYSQGPSTDSPFTPGQHIPSINVGGWFDAGDFDLRTQTHSPVITDLVLARENFGLDWDDTTVDESARYVQIRKPDGVPDAIQQVVHGVLYLLAQYKAFGHAIPGVIAPTLEQYTHLGDAASITDGKIYFDKMSPLQSDGIYSGVPDDRLAFTTHTTPLNYDAASSLAAASRVLRGFDDKMAEECLQTAENVWNEEHKQPPALFHSFNTTGGDLRDEETMAAVELLIATKGTDVYRKRLTEMVPTIRERFGSLGGTAARAIPFMDGDFKSALQSALITYKAKLDDNLAKNPYGVPIAMGTWGGSGLVAGFASQMYFLHQAFPDIVGTEYTLRSLDYLLGVHPASNLSYVSGIGTQSKLIGYGNNRADYTFIPGGVIPGVTILQPDFPELKSDWPFLWYENEYVVDTASAFILAANAAINLTK